MLNCRPVESVRLVHPLTWLAWETNRHDFITNKFWLAQAVMSSEALAWAFKQTCPSSSVKFTLVALCECANYKTGRIYPSIAHIEEITGQNRKTIISNISELERLGFVKDTGERAGATKQIKVYQASVGTVPKAEPSQKRNSSAFTVKQSQKRDTEPSREPSDIIPKGITSKRTDNFQCPELVDPIDWEALKANRKAKRAALTEGAHRQIVSKLKKWADDGWPPGPIVAYAAERGWTTVFETDEMKGSSNGQSGSYSQRRVTSDGGRPSGWLG